jgi:hypothetical protein
MSLPAPALHQRLVAATPDAITAGVFLSIWLAPLALGESAVRNAMLIMLIEFVMVHAAGFLGAFAFADRLSRRQRVLSLLGFAGFYLLFVLAFVLIFREWWPLPVFGWLLLSKLGIAMGGSQYGTDQQARMMALWVLSALFYLGGVFATLLLPLPYLGMQPDLLPQFGLVGSGLWVEQPHRVVAFGALYFSLCSWAKWKAWSRGCPPSLV